jgi:hypothetical protein
LRIPEAAADNIKVIVCSGGAEGGRSLELRVPWMANRSLRPFIPIIDTTFHNEQVEDANELHASVEVGAVAYARSDNQTSTLSIGGPSSTSTQKRWTSNENSLLLLTRRKTRIADGFHVLGDVWTFDPWMALQLGHPSSSPNPMNVIYSNFLARALAPFALCSGSLNITITFEKKFEGIINLRYQQSAGTPSLTDYPEITPGSTCNLPVIKCRTDIPFTQFQVPFGSNYDAIMLNGPLYPDGNQPREYSTCGTIIMSCSIPGQLVAASPVLYMSTGDDFILGPLRWIPKIEIGPNEKPDLYLEVPSEKEQKKKKWKLKLVMQSFMENMQALKSQLMVKII